MERLSQNLRRLFASPLLRRAGIYTLSHMASKALPFLLLPVLTYYLSPTDYGIVAMFALVASLLDPFITFSLHGAVTVKFHKLDDELPSFISSGVVVVLCAAVIVELLVLAFSSQISALTAVPRLWLPLAVVYVVCRLFGNVVMSIWRMQNRAWTYGLFQNGQSLAIVCGTLLLVVAAHRHWRGRIEADLVAMGITAVVAFVYLRRRGWLRLGLSGHHAKDLLRFGAPLIPHTLGSVLILQTDRFFVTNYVGLDETGLYTVGFQLAMIIQLAGTSINNAYTPYLFEKLAAGGGDMKRRLVMLTYITFLGVVSLAAIVTVAMPPFARLVLSNSFAGAEEYVLWFAIGFTCNAGYYLVSNFIFYAERTSWLAVVTISVAVVNVPLNYFLIQANGAIGAAQATAIAMAFGFVVTWIASSRVYSMPWLGSSRGDDEPDA